MIMCLELCYISAVIIIIIIIIITLLYSVSTGMNSHNLALLHPP